MSIRSCKSAQASCLISKTREHESTLPKVSPSQLLTIPKHKTPIKTHHKVWFGPLRGKGRLGNEGMKQARATNRFPRERTIEGAHLPTTGKQLPLPLGLIRCTHKRRKQVPWCLSD